MVFTTSSEFSGLICGCGTKVADLQNLLVASRDGSAEAILMPVIRTITQAIQSGEDYKLVIADHSGHVEHFLNLLEVPFILFSENDQRSFTWNIAAECTSGEGISRLITALLSLGGVPNVEGTESLLWRMIEILNREFVDAEGNPSWDVSNFCSMLRDSSQRDIRDRSLAAGLHWGECYTFAESSAPFAAASSLATALASASVNGLSSMRRGNGGEFLDAEQFSLAEFMASERGILLLRGADESRHQLDLASQTLLRCVLQMANRGSGSRFWGFTRLFVVIPDSERWQLSGVLSDALSLPESKGVRILFGVSDRRTCAKRLGDGVQKVLHKVHTKVMYPLAPDSEDGLYDVCLKNRALAETARQLRAGGEGGFSDVLYVMGEKSLVYGEPLLDLTVAQAMTGPQPKRPFPGMQSLRSKSYSRGSELQRVPSFPVVKLTV